MPGIKFFVLGCVLCPFLGAQAAVPLRVDAGNEELDALRKELEKPLGSDFLLESDRVSLNVPVLELPQARLMGDQMLRAYGLRKFGNAMRTFTPDVENGLWYTATDEFPGMSISVSADLGTIDAVPAAVQGDAGPDAMEISTSSTQTTDENDAGHMARVAFTRYGVPYVVDVECYEAQALCSNEAALRTLVSTLQLTWAPRPASAPEN